MSECIKDGLYHPNCQDSHTTYFGDILNEDDEEEPENQPKISPQEQRINEQIYNAEQRHNYCERQAQRFNRMSKYSLDEDNRRIYCARKSEWESKLEQAQENVEKLKNSVANSEVSGIIKADIMYRNKNGTHRRIGSSGQQVIDKPTYALLTRNFIKHNGIIIRGEEAKNHLKHTPGRAAYLPSLNAAFIMDDATVSDVLEEMYHAEQDRKHLFGEIVTEEVLLRREIDAQKYLLSVTFLYKIPPDEVKLTEQNLAMYEKELENFLKRDK